MQANGQSVFGQIVFGQIFFYIRALAVSSEASD